MTFKLFVDSDLVIDFSRIENLMQILQVNFLS
jgi:hypothetical protein